MYSDFDAAIAPAERFGVYLALVVFADGQPAAAQLEDEAQREGLDRAAVTNSFTASR